MSGTASIHDNTSSAYDLHSSDSAPAYYGHHQGCTDAEDGIVNKWLNLAIYAQLDLACRFSTNNMLNFCFGICGTFHGLAKRQCFLHFKTSIKAAKWVENKIKMTEGTNAVVDAPLSLSLWIFLSLSLSVAHSSSFINYRFHLTPFPFKTKKILSMWKKNGTRENLKIVFSKTKFW